MADRWRQVFDEHPELFRRSIEHEGEYGLLFRRATEGFDHAGFKGKNRAPLSAEVVKMLIDVARDLHQRAVTQKQDWRWWVGPSLTIINILLSVAVALKVFTFS